MDHLSEELAEALLSGELDAAARAKWEAHVRECAACAALVAREKTWSGLLKLDTARPPADGALERTLARVEELRRSASRARRLAGAGITVLAVIVGISIGRGLRGMESPPWTNEAAAELRISPAQEDEIVQRLDVLATLAGDPWLADHGESVRWLQEILMQEPGE